MKSLKLMIAAAVFISTSIALAQSPGPVSLEMRGNYSGKIAAVNYQSGQPLKLPSNLYLTIEENTCVFYTVDKNNQVSPSITGPAGQLGPYLYFKGVYGPIQIGGRLLVKGKAGKFSGSGPLISSFNDFLGLADGKITVKKISN